MNPVILKFAHEAGIKSTWEQTVSPAELKFAELIIRECASLALDGPGGILEHFGVDHDCA